MDNTSQTTLQYQLERLVNDYCVTYAKLKTLADGLPLIRSLLTTTKGHSPMSLLGAVFLNDVIKLLENTAMSDTSEFASRLVDRDKTDRILANTPINPEITEATETAPEPKAVKKRGRKKVTTETEANTEVNTEAEAETEAEPNPIAKTLF